MKMKFNVRIRPAMVARPGTYLFSSIAVHGVMFAALAATPQSEDPTTIARAIEFITITDTGGGRIGDDEQVGDALTPEEPPQRRFRKVRPKPKPVKKTPVAETTPPAEEPVPASDSSEAASATTTAITSTAVSHAAISGSAGGDPDATRSGTGTGGEGVDRRSALRSWLSEVQREVNKIASRNYPSSAVRMRLEGRLRLGVTIGSGGEIVAVRVLSSSGHPVLDESATASVRALHIPPPPEELRWREREISLPIRYALN